MNAVCFAATVLGCVGAGAWLVVQGHPWFGLLAMLAGVSAHFRVDDEKDYRRYERLWEGG